MSFPSHPFQALYLWLIEETSEENGSTLKFKLKEALEGFGRGHELDR